MQDYNIIWVSLGFKDHIAITESSRIEQALTGLFSEGSEDVEIGTFDIDSGTVFFDGTNSVTIPTLSTTFYNLTFDEDGSGNPTYTSFDATITVSGDLTITDGAFVADDDHPLIIGGNFTNSATFTANGGSVILTNTATATITSSGSAFNDLHINDGLVGYWKLDETGSNLCSGGVNDACDSSGYGSDGAHTNGPVISTLLPTVKFANTRSLEFDSNDDYVQIAPNSYINSISYNSYTVAAWINADGSGEGGFGRVADKAQNVTNSGAGWNFFVRELSGSSLKLAARHGYTGTNAVAISSTQEIPINEWHHVAYTANEDGDLRNKLYVDGVLVALGTNTAGAGAVPFMQSALGGRTRHRTH